MKCSQCGHENLPQAKFCAKCGAAITAPAQPTPSVPVTPTTGAVSKELKIGIIVGSVFIPLLGIIMGLIYMNDPNPEKKAVGKLWLYVGIGVIVLGCLCYAILVALGVAAGGAGHS
jgi:uncharacterized membrane protein YvbJ